MIYFRCDSQQPRHLEKGMFEKDFTTGNYHCIIIQLYHQSIFNALLFFVQKKKGDVLENQRRWKIRFHQLHIDFYIFLSAIFVVAQQQEEQVCSDRHTVQNAEEVDVFFSFCGSGPLNIGNGNGSRA